MASSITGVLTLEDDAVLNTKNPAENLSVIQISGTYEGLEFVIEGSVDGNAFGAVPVIDMATGLQQPDNAFAPSDGATKLFKVPSEMLTYLRVRATGDLADGEADVVINSQQIDGPVFVSLNEATQNTYSFPDGLVKAADTDSAGTDSASATVLPSGGTANYYPVTGADGAMGVRLHDDDNVDGRTVFIGNLSDAALVIYPPTGGTIGGSGVDVGYLSSAGAGFVMTCNDETSGQWVCIGGTPQP